MARFVAPGNNQLESGTGPPGYTGDWSDRIRHTKRLRCVGSNVPRGLEPTVQSRGWKASGKVDPPLKELGARPGSAAGL